MSSRALTVATLMTSPVRSVGPDVGLDEVHALLVAQRISSLPVLDAAGKALGLVSYTDLLRIGRMQPASLAGMQTMELPREAVKQHMHVGLITISGDAPVARAAKFWHKAGSAAALVQWVRFCALSVDLRSNPISEQVF